MRGLYYASLVQARTKSTIVFRYWCLRAAVVPRVCSISHVGAGNEKRTWRYEFHGCIR